MLLSKYDEALKTHVGKVIEESKRRHSSLDKGKQGRGSLVTFIYKTTVNYINEVIHSLQLQLIAEEVKEAGMYSIFRSIQLKT